jgi:ubiquinone/menaquinone biosynthesis C-methylase UbiE
MNPRSAFFDAIADKWDGWDDLVLLAKRMAAGLDHFGCRPHETVVDIGCGTGNLTSAILAALGGTGKVVAVDISPRMIEVARAKVRDPRVTWHVGSAESLPIGAASADRIVCFSVWPHLVDHQATLAEFARVLRPGGFLHIWHLISRQRVNEIHGSAGEAVRGDHLHPAVETAATLTAAGYQVSEAVEDDEHYLVSASKRSG